MRALSVRAIFLSIITLAFCANNSLSAQTDNIWELQSVDADGVGNHPKVFASQTPENLCVVEGISLASTGELDNPDGGGLEWYSIWVQSEEAKGGIQCFSGPWNKNLFWSTYPDVQAGDRVRVTGWAAAYNGKTFINDRHSRMMWSVEILSSGEMPEPEIIPSVADCNYFDQTRSGGGERWQTRWVKLKGVEIQSGIWAAGEELEISDGTGSVLMKLAEPGDFGGFTAPTGKFDVLGLFDQEDETSPYYDHYRIWIKNFVHITPQLTIQRGAQAGYLDLKWETKAGMTYTLMRSADMQNWTQEGSEIIGADTIQTVTVVPPGTPHYYKYVQGGVDSNIVGVFEKDLTVGRNLVSTPFLPFSTALDDFIGGQLTGNAAKFFSDTIERWDPATQRYDRAYYDPTGGGAWRDWDTEGNPVFGFDPDGSCWITILPFNPPRTLTLLGEVSETDRTIDIGTGRNTTGPSFPEEIALEDSGLTESGFTGDIIKYFSDTIEWWNSTTLKYDIAYYDPGDTAWKNWDGTAPSRNISPCEGFWIAVLVWRPGFTWTVPVPY